MSRHLAIALGLLLLAGCANPYVDNYQPLAHPALLPAPATAVPRLVKTVNLQEDSRKLAEDGYTLLGRTGFNDVETDDALALKHGQAVGAEVVLLWRRFTGAYQHVSTSVVPDMSTGIVTDSQGRSVSVTTYGQRSEVDTYYTRHYDYIALYWARRLPDPLGVDLRDLSVEERQKLRSNQGAVIETVVKRTPAFFANLIVGDVITAIDGVPVVDAAQAATLLEQRRGKKVVLTRNGSPFEVTLAP